MLVLSVFRRISAALLDRFLEPWGKVEFGQGTPHRGIRIRVGDTLKLR